MNTVFVDTAALIALGNKVDQYHAQALEIYTDLLQEKAMFITTNAVVFETANTFSKAQYKSSFFIHIKDGKRVVILELHHCR